MTLGRIIWNNARQRRLSSVLTCFSVALGVALIVAILIIKLVSQERLRLGYSGFDLVVGAKGSPLQLVLNVVYNLDASPGNIPYSLYERLEKDSRNKLVVPFSMGDNYKGFRIVATTDLFLKKFEPVASQPFKLESGRVFHFEESELRRAMREASLRSHKKTGKRDAGVESLISKDRETESYTSEAVLGAEAARVTGLKIGDSFVATHGVVQNEEGEQHRERPWTVVGILGSTGTPADRAIYINLDSFYRIQGHVIESKSETDGKEPEIGQISALALKTHGPFAVLALQKEINGSEVAQAALPAAEIQKLLSIIGNVDRILLAQAVLIILVSAIGTGLAMFNSMNERKRDVAVLRALGARRGTVLGIVVGEAILIAGIGGLLGLGFGHLAIQLASPAIQAAAGFTVLPWEFHSFEIFIFFAVLLVGAAAGLGPAISAYRTDVSTALSPNP